MWVSFFISGYCDYLCATDFNCNYNQKCECGVCVHTCNYETGCLTGQTCYDGNLKEHGPIVALLKLLKLCDVHLIEINLCVEKNLLCQSGFALTTFYVASCKFENTSYFSKGFPLSGNYGRQLNKPRVYINAILVSLSCFGKRDMLFQTFQYKTQSP